MPLQSIKRIWRNRKKSKSAQIIESCIIDCLTCIIQCTEEPSHSYEHKLRAHTYFKGCEILLESLSKSNRKEFECYTKKIDYLCFILTARLSRKKKSALAQIFIKSF